MLVDLTYQSRKDILLDILKYKKVPRNTWKYLSRDFVDGSDSLIFIRSQFDALKKGPLSIFTFNENLRTVKYILIQKCIFMYFFKKNYYPCFPLKWIIFFAPLFSFQSGRRDMLQRCNTEGYNLSKW